MKRTAYIRVSTEKQSFDRQYYDLEKYFKSHGIDPKGIEFVSEKITSHTSFREREIYRIIKEAKPGDIVYACQLDRFGRSVQDVLDLVDYAMKKAVKLITIDGHTIENRTPMGKMMLTMLAAFAEMERSLRAERCQSGYEAMKDEIKRNGGRYARSSGRWQTKIGNHKGADMTAANQASTISKQKKRQLWRDGSVGYKWVMDKLAHGVPRNEIIEEFNRLHELQPDVFCTPKGKKLSKGTLSHWINETAV